MMKLLLNCVVLVFYLPS